MPPNKKESKRGSALISALFIMTLIAIAATAMSTRLQWDIYRTQLSISSDELYLASQAVTFWAMDSLKSTTKANKKREASAIREFPKKWQHLYPGVQLRGERRDMQAVFNLNNVQDKKFHFLFFKLLEGKLEKSNKNQRQSLLASTQYWINSFHPAHDKNADLEFYLKQKPSYFPSYQPFKSVSEWRLVRGVNQHIYQALAPYLSALPEVTPININTAPKTLLALLGNGLSEKEQEELLEARGQDDFSSPPKLIEILKKLNIPAEEVTIESKYFLSVAYASSGDSSLTTYALIKRDKTTKGEISISIVQESLNSF